MSTRRSFKPPTAIMSSLFRSNMKNDSATTSSASSSSNFITYPGRQQHRRIAHDQYRSLLEQGKLRLEQMNKGESFIYWLMDGTKKIAIYCQVCEKFLSPNKGGSYFTHVRACKNLLNPGTLPSASITEKQKSEFSSAVIDAIVNDLNVTQLNTDVFKQCIQKALSIGFQSKQAGYGPPDASELFDNDTGMEEECFNENNATYGIEECNSESDVALFKDNILNGIIKVEEPFTPTPSIESNAITRAPAIGEQVFDAKEYTDIILKTSDGKEISAHRCFLSRVSPVFKELFEKNSSIINVEFNETVTLKALRFCYGIFFIVDGNENQLLKFATVYQMEGLKETCLLHLNDTLTPLTVCRIIETAYENNIEYLKKRCVQIIVQNKEVVGKENISNLPPAILCDILFA